MFTLVQDRDRNQDPLFPIVPVSFPVTVPVNVPIKNLRKKLNPKDKFSRFPPKVSE